MAIRLIILLVSILLHVLTPHWFLNDYMEASDYIMIFSCLISLLIYRLLGKNNWVFVLSLFLSINSLLFYITSVEVVTSEIEDERAVYRLLVLLNKRNFIDIGLSKLIETINALQIVCSVLIIFSLGVIYLRKRFVIK